MNKDVEIGQINELKFYLAWDYVKDICNEAVRKENEQLRKFLEEFNALEVAEENKKLKELLSQIRNRQSLIREYLSDCKLGSAWDLLYQTENEIDNATGEKK